MTEPADEALRAQLTEELAWLLHRCGDDCYEPPTDAERSEAEDFMYAIWPSIAAALAVPRAEIRSLQEVIDGYYERERFWKL